MSKSIQSFLKLVKGNKEDIFFILCLIVGTTLLIKTFPTISASSTTFDLQSYIALAKDPMLFFDEHGISSHHAQRIFPSLLVWLMHKLFSFSIKVGFQILSYSAFCVAILMIYGIFRSKNVSPIISFTTCVFCAISHWPMTYSLHNVYQATDALTYPLTLIIIMLTIRNCLSWLFIFSIIGVLTRQPLFVLSVLSFFFVFLKTKKFVNILYLGIIATIFLLSVRYAGGGASNALFESTIGHFKFNSFLKGILETRLPTLFTPFLLILFCRDTVKYLRQYWWIFLFMSVIIVQPLIGYDITGKDNAVRIMNQGIWLFNIIAGFILMNKLRSKTTIYIYAILPFLYGLVHLSFLKVPYESLIWHRHFSNIIIFALVVYEKYRQKKADVLKEHAS